MLHYITDYRSMSEQNFAIVFGVKSI